MNVADELAKSIAEALTPAGSNIFKSNPTSKKLAPPAPPLNQRLPRIVPDGKGGFIDLNTNQPVPGRSSNSGVDSSFLSNLVQKLHEGLGTGGWSKEQAAAQNLAGSGSIMANYQPPNAVTTWLRENPLMQTVFDALKGGAPSPIDAGNSQAIIGPIRTAAQKQVWKALFRADPEILKAVQESPKQFNIRIPEGGGSNTDKALRRSGDPISGNYGMHQEVNPVLSNITIHPNTLRGKSPAGDIYGSAAATTEPDLVSTALHEALHGFNSPLANETPLDKAQKVIDMIYPHLNKQGKNAAGLGNPERGMKEALSYLGETALRKSGSPLSSDIYNAIKPVMIESTNRQANDYIQQLLENALRSE